VFLGDLACFETFGFCQNYSVFYFILFSRLERQNLAELSGEKSERVRVFLEVIIDDVI
jgi:hypothetical protein